MPAPSDVSIHIEAEDRSRQAFRSAEQSLDSLERQTRELQGTTRATAQVLGLSGNAAQEAGTSFTSLGRQIFNTQEEAKRFGGVFRSLDGRLREANGRFVKGREACSRLDTGGQRSNSLHWHSDAFGWKSWRCFRRAFNRRGRTPDRAVWC